MTKQQLLDTARKLPRNEQFDLAMELWDAIAIGESDFPLTPEMKAELNRRIDEADKNPQPPVDFNTLKNQLTGGEF